MIAPSSRPSRLDPQSPMKTDAGWKLCTRKPSAAPHTTAASTPAAVPPEVEGDDGEGAAETRRRRPAASPSTPSEKLTMFIRATRPRTVSGAAGRARTRRGGRTGSVTSATETPESTSTSAAATWPSSLAAGESSRQSSSAPTAVISAAPARMPRVSVVDGDERGGAGQHAGEDGEAAEQRRRLARQAALLQPVHGADPPREPGDGGRQRRWPPTSARRKPRRASSFMPTPQRIAGRDGARAARPRRGSRRCVGRPREPGPRPDGHHVRDRSGIQDDAPRSDRPLAPPPAGRARHAARAAAFLALGDPARAPARPRRSPAAAATALALAFALAPARVRRGRRARRVGDDRAAAHPARQDLARGRRRGRRRPGRRVSERRARPPSPRGRRGRRGRASARRGASSPVSAIAPGRTVLRRLGGGSRYEVFLVWDEHRLAVLVAKVLRPDQATEAGGPARPGPRGRTRSPRSRTR